ncbi:GntR family transcriptional regulator [Virgibacillus senegalensis]|uniref:GntR family transcriptional regulator n=1 Tax=Virgibacillus senegalensis TaxID=1499679 RepID=UPI00069F8FD8|nr:GntR family transcriptional regulator [Virgibacillus senegalensis]
MEENKIDKEAVVPIYHQIKTLITKKIDDKLWNVDDMIPSERELTNQLSISRMTVRHAINDLVNEGVLYRKRGKGTFVGKPKIDQVLSKLSSFTEDMKKRGLKPGSKVLHVKEVPACEKIGGVLEVEEGFPVIEVFRLRLADDEPMALERSFLPAEKVASILNYSLENKSLYKELKEKYNLNVAFATQTIEISYLSKPQDSDLLEVNVGTPVLLIKRHTYSDEKTPLEYVESLYRADRYKFSIEMEK